MMSAKPYVSFIFGAGAEMPFGMPDGGTFALRVLTSHFPKEELKEEVARLFKLYSVECKADPYRNLIFKHKAVRPPIVHGWGASQQSEIFIFSAQHRIDEIADFCLSFTTHCESILKQLKKPEYAETDAAQFKKEIADTLATAAPLDSIFENRKELEPLNRLTRPEGLTPAFTLNATPGFRKVGTLVTRRNIHVQLVVVADSTDVRVEIPKEFIHKKFGARNVRAKNRSQ